MRSFLARHLFVVLGVSLPLMLIFIVLGLQWSSRWNVESPTTPVLYADRGSAYQLRHYTADVEAGRLTIDYRAPKTGQSRWDPDIELALYDPRDASLQRFRLDAPHNAEPGAVESIDLPEELRVRDWSNRPVSPDGFRFEIRRGNSGGLLGGLFGYSRGRTRFALSRDGAVFPVPGQAGYVLDDVFIAWAVDGDG